MKNIRRFALIFLKVFLFVCAVIVSLLIIGFFVMIQVNLLVSMNINQDISFIIAVGFWVIFLISWLIYSEDS